MDDDNNSRPISYWWLIILLFLAFLVCILIKSPNKHTKESVIKSKKESEKATSVTQDVVSRNLSEWNPPEVASPSWDRINLNDEIQTHPVDNDKSYYDKLNPGINSAIEQLQKKTKEAKRIIYYFPDFPGVWLLPPKNKGTFASVPERYCIEFLHLLFPGYTFVKGKQSWIRNPKTNYPLELDGYCSELMLAIEYNGIQHYVWPNFFHRTIEDFLAQRDRDRIKAEICTQEHICLIRIPYTIPLERIPLAIYAKLLEAVPGLKL